jgi:hypothetical protein
VRRSVPPDIADKFAVASKCTQEALILLPALPGLKTQKVVRLEKALQIQTGLLNVKSGGEIAIFVELGRAAISCQGAHPDFDVSPAGPFLSVKGGLRQNQRQKQNQASHRSDIPDIH